MEISITEFDVKFSTIISSLSACIVNYSEAVNKQINEMQVMLEKLKKENIRLVEKYESVKEEPVVPAPEN